MQQMDKAQQKDSESTPDYTGPTRKSRSSLLLSIVAALLFGIIYFMLPDNLTLVPSWLPLALEVVLLFPIVIAFLIQKPLPYKITHILIFIVLGIITLGLVTGVILLIVTLPSRQTAQATGLLRTGALLYISNILIFSLWYWEIDGGGPQRRHLNHHKATDFLFPQQNAGNPSGWEPHFIDYLFLAFTTSTAFSPTDTMPLSHAAKSLMMLESITAMTILSILIGRAINIL